jgi:hypothetical protein
MNGLHSSLPGFGNRLTYYNAREVQANAFVMALDVRDIPKIKNLTTAKAVWDRLADEFGLNESIVSLHFLSIVIGKPTSEFR